MKKFKSIRFFKILSLIAAFAVFLPSCSSSDDSNSGETEKEKSSGEGESKTDSQMEFTKKSNNMYHNTIYNSVWTTSVNGQELALCFGGAAPAWKLMTFISSAYEFIYAAGDYKDSTSNLNTDGTVLLTVTQCNSEVFDGKTLSDGVAVIKGNKCTLTLN